MNKKSIKLGIEEKLVTEKATSKLINIDGENKIEVTFADGTVRVFGL